MTEKQARITGFACAGFGVLLLSFDSLLIRLAATGSWRTAFYRSLFIFFTSLVIFGVIHRRRALAVLKKGGVPLLVSGLFWGLSGICFVQSVSLTIAANTLIMLSLSPLFAAALSVLVLGERIQKRTLMAIAASIIGVYIIFSKAAGVGRFSGNLIGFFVPVLLASNLTLLRKYPQIDKIAAVCIGGLSSALIALPFSGGIGLSPGSLVYLLLLGAVCIPFAQILISLGTRFLSSPEVGLILSGETFLGTLWIWLFIGEVPSERSFIGGAIILSALFSHSIIAILRAPKRQETAE